MDYCEQAASSNLLNKICNSRVWQELLTLQGNGTLVNMHTGAHLSWGMEAKLLKSLLVSFSLDHSFNGKLQPIIK